MCIFPPDSHIPQVYPDYSPQTAGDSDHSHTDCICRDVLGQLPAQGHTHSLRWSFRNGNNDAWKHETKTAPWSGISINWDKEVPISWRALILTDSANNKAAIVLKYNIEARSCNRCCGAKVMNITHFDCVFVALGIQHAMGKRHIVMWPVPVYSIFPH